MARKTAKNAQDTDKLKAPAAATGAKVPKKPAVTRKTAVTKKPAVPKKTAAAKKPAAAKSSPIETAIRASESSVISTAPPLVPDEPIVVPPAPTLTEQSVSQQAPPVRETVTTQPDTTSETAPRKTVTPSAESTPPSAQSPLQLAPDAAPARPTSRPAVKSQPKKITNVPPKAAVSSNARAASPKPARRKLNLVRWLAVAGLIAMLAAGYIWYQHRAADPGRQLAANRELVAEVSERAVLPPDETPTVTTVVDKSKANQSFLANAANGDKVLLYFQAGRAVLYRPSTHQVVNIGPLSQPPARVFLRDGTGGPIPESLTSTLGQQSGFSVISRDVSDKKDYTKTLVVDLAGNRPDLARRVAQAVGGTVTKLPDGESRPDADVLVITGSETK